MTPFSKVLTGILLFGFLLLGFCIGDRNSRRFKTEIAAYKNNQITLMQGLNAYRTSDSLKAVELGVLNMKLNEYAYFRSEDAKTIESLRIKNRQLHNITTTQSEMIAKLSAPIADTVFVFKDKTGNVNTDTVKTFSFHDSWVDVNGTILDNNVAINLATRDSLIIVESVTYRRFLGFLWKTKQIKDRKIDAVSKNPYNHIQSLERIQIDK